MRKLLFFVWAAIMFVACGKDDFGFKLKSKVVNPYAPSMKPCRCYNL